MSVRNITICNISEHPLKSVADIVDKISGVSSIYTSNQMAFQADMNAEMERIGETTVMDGVWPGHTCCFRDLRRREGPPAPINLNDIFIQSL